MAVRRKTGLDLAAAALERHVRAVADRQEKSLGGELSAADLASMVRAAESCGPSSATGRVWS